MLDEDGLETEIENAQQRLTEQHQTLHSFSDEGIKMLRIILLFIGVPLAAVGALNLDLLRRYASRAMSDTCYLSSPLGCFPIKYLIGLTAIILLFCIVANIMAAGYEARGTHSLTNPEDINNALKFEQSSKEYKQKRLEKYIDRIEHNDRIINTLESSLAFGKVSLVFTVYFSFVASYILIVESPVPFIYWMGLLSVIFAPIIAISWWLPYTYIRTDSLLGFNPLYNVPENPQNETNDNADD